MVDKPIGYKTQQALRWMTQEMALRPHLKRWELASEAAKIYDLDPRETELLLERKLPQAEELAIEENEGERPGE